MIRLHVQRTFEVQKSHGKKSQKLLFNETMGIEGMRETAAFEVDFKGNNSVQDIFQDSVRALRCKTSNFSAFLPSTVVAKLTDHLFLCSASSVDPTLLDQLNIKCIVNVAPELPDLPLHRNDLIYHKIGVLDSGTSKIAARFDEAVDLINKVACQGGNTLVFCVAGVSRSATICLAYLLKHQNLSLRDAYNHVKKRRPRIRPNCGFFRQLIEYEQSLNGFNTVKMVFNEMLKMEIPDVYDSDYRQIVTRRRRNNRRY